MGITLYFGVEYYKPFLLKKIIYPLTRKREDKNKSLKIVVKFLICYTAVITVIFLLC